MAGLFKNLAGALIQNVLGTNNIPMVSVVENVVGVVQNVRGTNNGPQGSVIPNPVSTLKQDFNTQAVNNTPAPAPIPAPNLPPDPNANYISLGSERAVNFSYILKTGDVTSEPDGPLADKKVNLNGNDAYAQAQRQINADTINRINADPACVALLQKDSWSRDDRAQWEQQVALHAAEARTAIPGLVTYRTSIAAFAGDPNLKHTASLNNDLSPDIVAAAKNPNAKPTAELDCKDMSIIEGMAMQNAENTLLKGQQGGPDNFKKAGNYFLMTGDMSDSASEVGAHDYIYTPLGNVVEATQDPSGGANNVYRQAVVQRPWDAVFKGKDIDTNVTGADGSTFVYGHLGQTGQHIEAAREAQSKRVLTNQQAAKQQIQTPQQVPATTPASAPLNASPAIPTLTPVEEAHLKAADDPEASAAPARTAPQTQAVITIPPIPVLTPQEYATLKAEYDAEVKANADKSAPSTAVKTEPAPPAKDVNTASKDPDPAAKTDSAQPPASGASEITKLQQGLKAAGLVSGNPTGTLDNQTRQALESLIVRAQMTGVYKATGDHIDGIYGKDTQKAFDAMVAKGQISKDLADTVSDLSQKGELENVYSRGNLGATIAAIQKDPAAVKMINEIAAAPAPSAPAPATRALAATL